MAVVTGLAFSAAVLSSISLGRACSLQMRRAQKAREEEIYEAASSAVAARFKAQQMQDKSQYADPEYEDMMIQQPNRRPATQGSTVTNRRMPRSAAGTPVLQHHTVQPQRSPQMSPQMEHRSVQLQQSPRMESRGLQDMQVEDEPPLGWQGFSMEEARLHADRLHSEKSNRTPKEVLEDLQRGNTRFWMNTAVRPEMSAFSRRGLISKQFPSVAILGCSDSRVPTEIVFDQGLGDIFVIRVAGNCLDTATLASLQYSVHHLKVKVLVVLGHEMCGAVKAAMLPDETLEQEPLELEQALKMIKTGLDATRLEHITDTRAIDREAVSTNVKKQVERLSRDKGIIAKVRQEDLLIVGAFYEISSGIVDFFYEVSGPYDMTSPFSRKNSLVEEVEVPEFIRSTSWTSDGVQSRYDRRPSDGVQSRYEPEEEAGEANDWAAAIEEAEEEAYQEAAADEAEHEEADEEAAAGAAPVEEAEKADEARDVVFSPAKVPAFSTKPLFASATVLPVAARLSPISPSSVSPKALSMDPIRQQRLSTASPASPRMLSRPGVSNPVLANRQLQQQGGAQVRQQVRLAPEVVAPGSPTRVNGVVQVRSQRGL